VIVHIVTFHRNETTALQYYYCYYYYYFLTGFIMPPPLRVGALSDDARLTSVCCLTYVAYIGHKSTTERPRKTKIGTEVAHVTNDSDTTFKVKRLKVKVRGGGIVWRPNYKPHNLFQIRLDTPQVFRTT